MLSQIERVALYSPAKNCLPTHLSLRCNNMMAKNAPLASIFSHIGIAGPLLHAAIGNDIKANSSR